MAFQLGNIQLFSASYSFSFMRWRRLTIGISCALVLAALLVIGVKGLNYGIDFLGGTEIQLYAPLSSLDDLKKTLHDSGFPHAEITTLSPLSQMPSFNGQAVSDNYLVRIPRQKGDDEGVTAQKISHLVAQLSDHKDKAYRFDSLTTISGKVGQEDEWKGAMALLFACIGILIYIGVRFDARFAPGAVLCLIHNVVIALGFMTALGRPFTTASIAAFLTIVGYSINDTVIVYDRIRETRLLQPLRPLVDVVNYSISQTMNRTVLTSITGILALTVLCVLGGGSIQDFAITMLVGIVVGTYSSIYVAAPLTLVMDDWLVKRGFLSKEPKQGAASTARPADFAPPILIRKKPKAE